MLKPAPRERVYSGHRQPKTVGPGEVVRIDNGAQTPLDPRFDIREHSPDGFQWGYAGSGPAQLALALVADATGDDALAQMVYQQFKFDIVAQLGDSWRLTAGSVADFAQTLVGAKA